MTVVNGISIPTIALDADIAFARTNKGKDFGAWQAALSASNLDEYEYVFLCNETVAGPFAEGDWLRPFTDVLEREPNVAMVGISQSNEIEYHVQSMALCLRAADVKDMLTWEMWQPAYIESAARGGRRRMVRKCEVALTREWLRRGRTVHALSPQPEKTENPWLSCTGITPEKCVFVKHTNDFHPFHVSAEGRLTLATPVSASPRRGARRGEPRPPREARL